MELWLNFTDVSEIALFAEIENWLLMIIGVVVVIFIVSKVNWVGLSEHGPRESSTFNYNTGLYSKKAKETYCKEGSKDMNCANCRYNIFGDCRLFGKSIDYPCLSVCSNFEKKS